jgi:hypothetical protein
MRNSKSIDSAIVTLDKRLSAVVESTREPFRLAPAVLLLLAIATRHLDERVADEVFLEDFENRAANRPLRGERRRGQWTRRRASHRLLRRASASSALRPREGTISPVDPSPTDLRRSQGEPSAQRAANGEASAPTEVGLMAGGKTARRAGSKPAAMTGSVHSGIILTSMQIQSWPTCIRMMLPIATTCKRGGWPRWAEP